MLGEDLADVARHRRVEPGTLSGLLRDDLDWIVMKALEKDRTRRYETANALAGDVMLHLRDEPVTAGPRSVTYKLVKFIRRNRTMVVAASLVAAALIVGFGLATVGLVRASRDRDVAVKATAEAVAEATRSHAIIESLRESLAYVDPERVMGLGGDAQGVLSLAREVVMEASPMPVSFGKWAELDALRAANWEGLGETAENLIPLIREVTRRLSQGREIDAELLKKVQQEENGLVRLVAGIRGQIPTHSACAGEYTHPLVLINLMGAMLDRSKFPFTVSQKASLVAIGVDFEARYEKRQKDYSDPTPQLRKVVDELELKRDCMLRMEEVLTPEQREVVIDPEIHHLIAYDILAPGQMVYLFSRSRNLSFKEQANTKFPSELTRDFELNAKQRDALGEAFGRMYKDLTPLLEQVRDEHSPVHLDETITAGLAFARLHEAALRLPDLSAKSREKILNVSGWAVPRVVPKPADETLRAIRDLRRRHGPNDERIAEEYKSLAKIFEDRGEDARAIQAVKAAIDIYRKTRGENWNNDALRLRLGNLAWRIARDPEQTPERYELAREAAKLVLSLKPQSATSLRALGALQYRLELYEEAVETLERSDKLHQKTYEGGVPNAVGFLAMAHHRAGNTEEAQAALARIRELMKSSQHSRNSDNRRIFAEVETFFGSSELGGETRQ